MIAFGSNEHLAFMAGLFALGLLFWAVRSLYRAFRHELHADDIRRIAADTKTYLRGSAATTTSVETRPAPVRRETSPGAGTDLQVGDSCLDRDSVALPSRDESQPAPRNTSQPSILGAGLELATGVLPPDRASVATGAVSPSLAAPATRSAA